MADLVDDIGIWYNQEVYPKRLLGCIASVWSIVFLSSNCLSFLLQLDLIHPLQWFQDGLTSLFSFSTYLYIFALMLLTLLLVVVCSYTYKSSCKVFLNRFEIVVECLRPFNLAILTCYGLIGSLCAWLYLGLKGGDLKSLVFPCDDDKLNSFQCLNDRHLFIVFHGAFVAVMYGFDVIIYNYNCVNVPLVQQRRFIQIKCSTYFVTKKSIMEVAKRVKYFLFLYAIWGCSICERFTSALNLSSRHNSTWSLMLNLLNFELWWSVMLTGSTIYFLFHIVTVIYNVFHTQRLIFPIHSILEEEVRRNLSSALSCKNHHLIRLLGFLDLNLLSYQSAKRRQDLYLISIPGGHLIYWNTVINECFDLLKSLTNSLKFRFDSKESRSSPKSFVPPEQLFGNTSHKMFNETSYSSTNVVSKSKENLSSVPSLFPNLTDYLAKIFSEKWNAIKNLSAVLFFTKELPLAVVNKIFAECQLHIYAIESLSFLTIYSLTEEKYGVVQKDLAEILETLVDLQKAINRVLRAEMGLSKKIFIHPLAISLQGSLRLSIYRIVTNFENYLGVIGVSQGTCQFLMKYKEFEDYQAA